MNFLLCFKKRQFKFKTEQKMKYKLLYSITYWQNVVRETGFIMKCAPLLTRARAIFALFNDTLNN